MQCVNNGSMSHRIYIRWQVLIRSVFIIESYELQLKANVMPRSSIMRQMRHRENAERERASRRWVTRYGRRIFHDIEKKKAKRKPKTALTCTKCEQCQVHCLNCVHWTNRILFSQNIFCANNSVENLNSAMKMNEYMSMNSLRCISLHSFLFQTRLGLLNPYYFIISLWRAPHFIGCCKSLDYSREMNETEKKQQQQLRIEAVTRIAGVAFAHTLKRNPTTPSPLIWATLQKRHQQNFNIKNIILLCFV